MIAADEQLFIHDVRVLLQARNFYQRNGGFVVAWMSASQDGDGNGVFGRVFATPEGLVPPDPATNKCELAVAANLTSYELCLAKCHKTAAIKAFKGQVFDEESCEKFAPKSCRVKYDTKLAKINTTGGCGACLNATQQTDLADIAHVRIDDSGADLFCSGSTPLP